MNLELNNPFNSMQALNWLACLGFIFSLNAGKMSLILAIALNYFSKSPVNRSPLSFSLYKFLKGKVVG